MLKLISTVLFLTLILLPGCNDKSTVPETVKIYSSDLEGAWRGTLATYRVDNGAAAKSYTLQDLRLSMILDSQTYWFEISYYSDTLEFVYLNRGNWLVLEGDYPALYFAVNQYSSDQRFLDVDSLDHQIIVDRITSGEGDGSAMVGEWSCEFDYSESENTLRLTEFYGSLIFEELNYTRE